MALLTRELIASYAFIERNNVLTKRSWGGESTLEHTFMAPVRRWAQLLGSTMYAVLYALAHAIVMLLVLALFLGLDFGHADPITAIVLLGVGSLSFIGIGMVAAIVPLMYVERGAQMTFVFQSMLLLASGVYYSIGVPDKLKRVG